MKGTNQILARLYKIGVFSRFQCVTNLREAQDSILDCSHSSQLAYFRNSSFEENELKLIRKLIKSPNNILDIGANWGLYSVYLSDLVGDGNIFAIEANPQTFSYLTQTLHRNKIVNVTPLNIALSDTNGKICRMDLPWYRNDTAGFLQMKKLSNMEPNLVTTKTLDSIWSIFGYQKFNFIKIDVEGFEPLVLKGASKFLSNGVLDDTTILIEISSWCESRCGLSYKYIYETLHSFNFIFKYKVNDILIQLTESECPSDCYVLFSKKKLSNE